MDRTNGAGHVNHMFVAEDLPTNRPPSEVTPEWLNTLQEELAAFPEFVGNALDPNNNHQVLDTVLALIQERSGNYALDTGAANAYVVALSPAITAYTDGMTVRVKAVNANNGASTLNAGGGAVALVNDVGGALIAGDVSASSIFTATYIASAGKFYFTSLVQSQRDARYAKLAGLSTQSFSVLNLTINGVANLPAGSVAAPSLYFGYETGTGLYRIGANNTGYAINGVNMLDISSTRLRVEGAINCVGYAYISQSTVNSSTKTLWNSQYALYISNDDITAGNVAKLVLNTSAGGYNNGGIIHCEGAGGYSNGQLVFSVGWDSTFHAVEKMRISGTDIIITGTLRSSVHNTDDLGTTAVRWKNLWLQSGAFNGSDARLKTAVIRLSSAEINAAKQLAKEVGTYQWLESVTKKGDAARHHVGMTVQRAIEIMQANGLDPFAYGMIGYDQWDDIFTEHPAVEAVAAKPAESAEYEEQIVEEKIIVSGEEITVQRKIWRETKAAVAAVVAVEAQPAWTEQTQKAGDAYSFRYDQLNMFIAAGLEARIAALEGAM